MMLLRTRTRSNSRRGLLRTTESSALKGLREQAAVVTRNARHVAARARAVARRGMREHVDPIREYLAEKPLRSLLIGGGIGLVLGFFLGRR